MAPLHGFFFCVIFLIVMAHHQAYASRGVSGLSSTTTTIVEDPFPNGICATSVRIYGYKCQEFQVRTKDGYILSVQRIPEGRLGSPSTNRPPVLMQHGVLVDGAAWLLNSPDQNLPMVLADKGFDVWIANTRGTRFSRLHSSLGSDQPEFWNWSWDELVAHDLPAVFDHVYVHTNQKIHYIAHSQGTLIGLASFSQGLLADRVKSAVLLSPIAYLSYMNTAIGVIAAKSLIGEITTLFGYAEFNPKGKEVAAFLKALCAYPGVNCYDLLAAITGKNCCLNSSTVDLFLKNEPQSTATKNMVHLAQTVRYGVIAKFDYGNLINNMQHYGQEKPPIYDLTKIANDFPIFISYGGQDALSDVRDVQLLLDHFKFHDVDKITVQFIKDYAHADFIMGFNARDLVYNQIYSFLKLQH